MSAPLVKPGSLDDLITWLGRLDTGNFRHEIRKLRAIREWALAQAGIDYAEGGKVRLVPGYLVTMLHSDGSASGWWHYRECLAGGAEGTATRIDFSPHHMAWVVYFRPDREWSVGTEGPRQVRRWHGPAADTPEGFEPPSAFDQEHYPDGRKHVFMMAAADLEKADSP